jgi:hypothetical protein
MWERAVGQLWVILVGNASRIPNYLPQTFSRHEHPIHPSYPAFGGYLREEAIMILRRFYITENTHGEWEHHQNWLELNINIGFCDR